MIDEIRPHLKSRQEMLFHVLWSGIMDGNVAWMTAQSTMQKQIKSGDTSIQNKAWLLYPTHAFMVGTNSYEHLKITWSHHTPRPNELYRLIKKYENTLVQSRNQSIPIAEDKAKDELGKYGLVDHGGKVRLFAVDMNSEMAQLYLNLGSQFGQAMMKHLQVAKVVELLDVPPGTALLIAYHETCYELLKNLAEHKLLEIPRIVLKPGADLKQAVRLVSLVIPSARKEPFLQTPMTDEEKAIIERFNTMHQKILDGEKHFDLSTPLDALLSYISAIGSKDPDAYQKVAAALQELQLQQDNRIEITCFEYVGTASHVHSL